MNKYGFNNRIYQAYSSYLVYDFWPWTTIKMN